MAWLRETKESFAGAKAASVKLNRCDLNEFVVIRAESGGLEIVDNKRFT